MPTNTFSRQTMRSVLCVTIFLTIGLVLVLGPKPVNSCTDWDEDGVCASSDCNDYNPAVGYDGDNDGDGVTVCQGDCEDSDPSILKCGEIFRMYPVIYQPPEQPCHEGFTVTTKYFNCWWQLDWDEINQTYVWVKH